MTRLVVAFCIFALAALLAAVGWVLARPRWRWEPPEPPQLARACVYGCVRKGGHSNAHQAADGTQWSYSTGPIGAAQAAEWMAEWQRHYSTGSPWSVTSRIDNGTNWEVKQ